MGFQSSANVFIEEHVYREGLFKRLIPFGVTFLDDALRGILPGDLVVVGAYTGSGKTQFCVNIALSAISAGKKVHFFALEAEPNEIERRLKFMLLSHWYHERPEVRVDGYWNYADWMLGKYESVIGAGNIAVNELAASFENLNTYYRESDFTMETMVDQVMKIKDQTDLIILDHLHYIDWDDSDDNKALKQLTKIMKDLAQFIGKPIILISHLRKRNFQMKEIVPGVDEFHGSSDITKIATKVITMASGEMLSKNQVETFFRIAKNRLDGSVSKYIGRTKFDFQKGKYDEQYQIGGLKNSREEFEPLGGEDRPYWASKPTAGLAPA
jgi:replicative DNA helicase